VRLDHVALTVADRERSATFYARHLGFGTVVHEDDHLLILGDASGGLLALSAGVVPPLPRTNHFGVRAPSAEAVRTARERFAAAGVQEAEWQDDGTFVRIQVLDPDGYRVDVYAT
jgi:catechol 2,3-dioxygenase-like lactoylglutathione lyase family enzyme